MMNLNTLKNLLILGLVLYAGYEVFYIKNPKLAVLTLWSMFDCHLKPSLQTDDFCDPFLGYEVSYPKDWAIEAPKGYEKLKAHVKFSGPPYLPSDARDKNDVMIPHMVLYPIEKFDLSLTGRRKFNQNYLHGLEKGVSQKLEIVSIANGNALLIETIDGTENRRWRNMLIASNSPKYSMALLLRIPEMRRTFYEKAMVEIAKSLTLPRDNAPQGVEAKPVTGL